MLAAADKWLKGQWAQSPEQLDITIHQDQNRKRPCRGLKKKWKGQDDF